MPSSKIDIKVNCDGDQKQSLYKKISLSLQLGKNKLQTIHDQLCQIVGSTNAPFLLIQLPTIDFKGIELPIFNDQVFDHKQLIKNNKLYHFGNPKRQQTKKFINNLNKSFNKLTQLNNKCFIQLKLYQSQQKKTPTTNDIFQKSQIKGQFQLDQHFVGQFKQLLMKVSPQFCNSPILIFLEIIQQMDLKMNLEKFDLISDQLKKSIIQLIKFNSNKDQKIIQIMKSTKEQLTIFITLDHLFSIKIKGPSNNIADLLLWFE